MNYNHVEALLLVHCCYLMLTLSFFGWGKLCSTALFGEQESTSFLAWLGWCISLLMLQLIHCLTPITIAASISVLVVGAGYAVTSKSARSCLKQLGVIASNWKLRPAFSRRFKLDRFSRDAHANQLRFGALSL